MIRSVLYTRSAMGLALALGLAGGLGVATPAAAKDKPKAAAAAPKITPSKAFIPVYSQAKNAIDAAAKRKDVIDGKAAVTNAENAYRAARGKRRARTQAGKAAWISSATALDAPARKGPCRAGIYRRYDDR